MSNFFEKPKLPNYLHIERQVDRCPSAIDILLLYITFQEEKIALEKHSAIAKKSVNISAIANKAVLLFWFIT